MVILIISIRKHELNAMYKRRAWSKQSVKRYFSDSWENRPWAGYYYMILVSFAGSAIVVFCFVLFFKSLSVRLYHVVLKYYDISNLLLNILAKQN